MSIQRKRKQSKDGVSRNQSSTMPDNWEENSLLNQTINNLSAQWKPLGESLKFRCQQQCLVKYRQRAVGNPPQYWKTQDKIRKFHQDHNTAKGTNSMTHYSLFHKFIPMPEAFKNSGSESSSGQGIGKTGENSGMAADESQKQERGDRWSNDEGRKSSFCLTDGPFLILRIRSWNLNVKKNKGRVVFRGDIVKDDSGSYAVFTEQGSSASQMTAAKVMDVISRLPGCSGQAADAVSAYTQVKMEDAPSLLKNSEVRMSRYLDTSTKTQMT